jgi:alginate O-acetyltransferase complex protein AlgI
MRAALALLARIVEERRPAVMSFVSYAFVLFFAVMLTLRLVLDRLPSREPYLTVLLLGSLAFYAWHVPAYLLLLFTTCGVDFFAARRMHALPAASPRRRWLLVLSLTVNLGLLGFFKYFDFLALSAFLLAFSNGFHGFPLLHVGLALPIGLSFYTFESMSYTIDVYRGRIGPERRVRNFLIFISFFPHLVAGPIVRARDFLYQVKRRRRPRARVMMEGAYLMIRGYFLKIVLADNLARIVDQSWKTAATPGTNATFTLLLAALFALQILCDFDGYSTIARGAAYLFGFRLPLNFDYPYVAGTFREFWQRWHITLSQWLRDYLYVPLGGNRLSRPRMYVNLALVMLLGGLWHGAGWTFVVWGGIHGAALALERALGLHTLSRTSPLPARLAWFLLVQAVVLVAWVFFRSPTLGTATAMLRNLVTGPYHPIADRALLTTAALLALPVVASHLNALLRERGLLPQRSLAARAVWSAVMLYAICTAYGPTSAFIYFQF